EQDLGYDTKIVVMESPFRNIFDFLGKIRSVIGPSGVSWWTFGKVFRKAWEKLKVLDDIEFLSHQIRPFELKRGDTTNVFSKCLEIIDQAGTIPEINEVRVIAKKMLNDIPVDRSRQVLKVGIVGEIYVVLEPFANHDIEITLGEMGVLTHRSIYLSDWTRESTGYESTQKVIEVASPYIDELFGGHGIYSVGHSILYSKKGFDGVVQLAPFTCIPEIVAKPILNKVTQDYNIPVLTVFLDEQTGKAGLQTRLEAFVDLLAQKRDKLEGIAI
ncbi:MAG: CoA protein activase, partial [Firmicutes bacterium]|nr:CoA protein activase [Bacillota bacterium]